jgi:hypothetical protein
MSSLPEPGGSMSRDEVTDYLEATEIPVRIACRTPAGRLWMVSLWYRFVGAGTIACATGADATLVRYLEEDPGVAFEISENDPPYRGVRGAGTVSLGPDEDKALLRSLLERYLGGTDSDLATMLLSPEREEVRIEVEIERLYAWDFSDRMATD